MNAEKFLSGLIHRLALSAWPATLSTWRHRHRSSASWAIAILLACGWSRVVSAQTVTQTLALKAGWNSIYLEVDPLENSPERLFAGAPVEIVSALLVPVTSTRYIQNPEEIGWNSETWGTWYAPQRADGFLTTLYAIRGGQPYLLFSRTDTVLSLQGTPLFKPVVWKPNSFNFVGLPIDPSNPPTFGSFFGFSSAHAKQPVFRLVDGKWKQVSNPDTARLSSGEAFWIFCRGGSDYQGPLSLSAPPRSGLDFGALAPQLPLHFANLTAKPGEVRIVHRPENPSLPLNLLHLNSTTRATEQDPLEESTLLLVPAGEREYTLNFGVSRELMTMSTQVSCLEITTAFGSRYWLRVSASRSPFNR